MFTGEWGCNWIIRPIEFGWVDLDDLEDDFTFRAVYKVTEHLIFSWQESGFYEPDIWLLSFFRILVDMHNAPFFIKQSIV